jgi:hypothetical protein
MSVKEDIKAYIEGLPEEKSKEIQTLHKRALKALPKCKLWYSDGKNEKGKLVTNPSIGYGSYIIKYANGTEREFFQVGIGSNATGVSVHILGIKDKTALIKNFAKKIGKAKVTGYCVNFKSINDIDVDVLMEAIKFGVKSSGNKK